MAIGSAVARHTITQTGEDMSRERLECDRQVAALMSTNDIVALERAMFLIKQFNCSVSRRLPPL